MSAHRIKPATSTSDLFPPEELDELFHVRCPFPGDILLLNSDRLTGRLSRLFQGGGHFSHVGIVVAHDIYIDAVRKVGVRFRPVQDLLSDDQAYVLEKCVVARSRRLFRKGSQLLSSSVPYMGRRYRLSSLFSRGFRNHAQKPMICSSLVVHVVNEISRLLRKPPHRALPSHVDRLSRGRGWSRFPLAQYDFIQEPTRLTGIRLKQQELWLSSIPAMHSIDSIWRSSRS